MTHTPTHRPKPGEPGFIGPVRPKTLKEGEPGFIGPVRPKTPIEKPAEVTPLQSQNPLNNLQELKK